MTSTFEPATMSELTISGFASVVIQAVSSGVWSKLFRVVRDTPAPRRRVTMSGRSDALRVCPGRSWVRRGGIGFGGPTAVWSGVLPWFEG